MIVFREKSEIIKFITEEKRKGSLIGFIPTMGALHGGHIELIRASIRQNTISVCSIYVNPVQFNNSEDYTNYPVTIDTDLEILEKAGCNVVFIPDNREMYDNNPEKYIGFSLGYIDTVCEGKFRPGHFNGVCLIISKLFNILVPDNVYLGQKDLQQCAVIRKIVNDLSYRIQIRRVPTFREPDGLAMSSRNLRIAREDRSGAVILYNSLLKARKMLLEGSPVDIIRKITGNTFQNNPVFRLEYLELVHVETFELIGKYTGQANLAFCIAGYCRNIRLIDNILINE